MASTCHRCGSDDIKALYQNKDYISGEAFNIVSCSDCTLAYTDISPNLKDLSPYYPPTYYGSSNSRFWSPLEQLTGKIRNERARKIEKQIGKIGSVLDVGCGRGLMLQALKERGWQVCGIEFSEDSSRHAREILKLDVRIAQGDSVWDFANHSFDVITFWHVLEHLLNPYEALCQSTRVLKPGGQLWIEVPNLNSMQAKIGKGAWFHLDAPRHLFHFSPQFLKQELRRAGLDVIESSSVSYEMGPFGMIQTLLNRLSSEPNVLYGWLRNRSAKVGTAKFQDVVINGALVFPMGILSVLLEGISWTYGRGSVIRILARKPLPRTLH